MTVAPRRSLPARDARADSLAGVLIVLVVFGHAILVVPGSAARAAELFVYAFHMPAFVWLSGYLTQYSRAWSVGQLVARLLFPFVVFQVIHRLFISQLLDIEFSLGFPGISWTLWYLFALFVWRMAAIVLVRTPWTLAIAVTLSLVAGLFPFIGYDYSLSRILGFLPFFVAGLWWRREWFEVLSRWWWAGGVVLVAAAVWAVVVRDEQSIRPFHMGRSYERLGVDALEGVLSRSVLVAGSAVLVLAVIAVFYRRIPLLESVGRATLPVYLLHPLVLMPWYIRGEPIGVAGEWAVIGVALASCLFAVVASRAVVARAIRPLSDFTWWSSRWRIGSERERAYHWR